MIFWEEFAFVYARGCNFFDFVWAIRESERCDAGGFRKK